MTLTRETIRQAMRNPANKLLVAHPSIAIGLRERAPEQFTLPQGERQYPAFGGIQIMTSPLCVTTEIEEDSKKQDRRMNNRIQARRRKRNKRLGKQVTVADAYIVDMEKMRRSMNRRICDMLYRPKA